ncbi:MAG: ATP-binding protein [Desulfatiglans sp.]|jgi:two-component system sensor histidine kinase FlrB|nr:ATP-binding protein [Desulfatiglans sp.]
MCLEDNKHLIPEIDSEIDGVSLLKKAIESFNGAAASFENHYRHLEQRIKKLDIELKRKNEELETNLIEKEEMKDHLNNVLESLASGVIVVDLKGDIITFSRPAGDITGLIPEEVRGKAYDKVFGVSFFQELCLDFESINNINETAEFETEIVCKEKAPAKINLSVSPLTNPEGKRVGIVLNLQDISHMKRLEEQASRTDRLSAMGEMAIRIAHDIRNPLGSIELVTSILRKELMGVEELEDLATHISSGVKSINSIVSNLLLFIKPEQKAELKTINIHEPLDDSLFFSCHRFHSEDSIEVITDYDPGPLLINGDLELLKQVYLNLILNSIQAMPDGGRLTITTRKAMDRQGRLNLAEITFADTGTGISKKDMTRIFDPFFTTKKRGTGLGLAIVHNIVKLHKGFFDVKSSEGGGTTCTICVPLKDE